MIDFIRIDAKWQKAWADAKIFEPEVSDKKPYLVFAAFPYANAPQHIGHLRTYGIADLLARYKRMQGYNVLYPMAFHATSTPIIAFAKRIKNNDAELIKELKMFHVPDADIARMTDPLYIVNYFTKELENGMHLAGFSIDWRRKFVTLDPQFSKFIEWQFGILNEKGYLMQGKHPLGWCPNENNAVGMHDTLHDMEPEIEKQVMVKFMVDGENACMPCNTYRPETIFGVTNIFVKENAKYVLCKIDGSEDSYYLSKASSEVLKYQFKIEVLKEVDSREMFSKICINPVTKDKIPVLPGFFVKEEVGTGIVMSVPAHAPFDYAALQRLKAKGYPVPRPIRVLDVQVGRSLSDVAAGEAKPIHLDTPALAYLEVLHADENAIDDVLEFATKLEYREESHWGKMTVKGYEGMAEPEAREKITEMLLKDKNAAELYVLVNGPIYCRCQTPIVVKLVENQWFLNYGDPKWKEEARSALKEIRILPEKSRSAFESALEWINLRAVARSQGLGTRFPLDKDYTIEPLSDSTIYPAFYTIANYITDIGPDLLKPEFFNYVFLNKGDLDSVAGIIKVDYSKIKQAKESFEYWYVMTSNHSAPELIYNHFTMYIFNHAAIFDKRYWPKQIVTNGTVLCEGEKMSKSLGNTVPLVDGLKKYGADPLRINTMTGADLYSDAEFNTDAIRGIQERLSYLYGVVLDTEKLSGSELRNIDYWLYSKLNRKIEAATASMEIIELRDAYLQILYNSVLELRRYFARGGNNSIVVKDFISAVALMLQPAAPHVSEEFWHVLNNDTFSSLERWPVSNKEMISEKAELCEGLIDAVIEDAKQVNKLMLKKGKKPKNMKIIVAEDWKRTIINALAKEKNVDAALNAVRADGKVNIDAASQFINSAAKRLNEVREVNVTQQEELDALASATEYIASQLGCSVEVEAELGSGSSRAARSAPMKPSLDISFG